MANAARIMRFLLNHGVRCADMRANLDGSVAYRERWTNVHTGETGFDSHALRSVGEAREAMGY